MKKKVLITFPSNLTKSPITYNLIKNHDLKVNILRAAIKFNEEGELLLELEGAEENINSAVKYLEDIGVGVDLIHTNIERNIDACIHCGACTAVCNAGALSMDQSNWTLKFDDEKCVGCLLCIKACPLKIISSCV